MADHSCFETFDLADCQPPARPYRPPQYERVMLFLKERCEAIMAAAVTGQLDISAPEDAKGAAHAC